MNILVDTSVWSLALRRPQGTAFSVEQTQAINALTGLVRDGRATLMGAIRQELLSGIKLQSQFDTLRSALTAFDDVAVTEPDYALAAQMFNTCRANGVQGSNTDFLICAVSVNHQLPIFSLDLDFECYQKWLPIRLYQYRLS